MKRGKRLSVTNIMAITRHTARRLRALQQQKLATSDVICRETCKMRLVKKGKVQQTKTEKQSAFQKTIMNICSQLREHHQIQRLVKMHCHLNVSNNSTTMYFIAELR